MWFIVTCNELSLYASGGGSSRKNGFKQALEISPELKAFLGRVRDGLVRAMEERFRWIATEFGCHVNICGVVVWMMQQLLASDMYELGHAW
jgi:hypothetical protein